MAKIISLSQLHKECQDFKKRKQKVVLATGVFDLLHKEHKRFLKAAKKQGNILIVGLETDKRVKKLKGSQRPVWKLEKRLEKTAELSMIDYVFSLPNKFDTAADHKKLISLLKPQILAVSSHTPHLKEKQSLIKKYGGKLRVVLSFNPGISTSKILINKTPLDNW